ncbi:DUF421 domain-containing protein [Bryobacterales bacterium F-183]|nr:DUF421 domain-containing protein [Bryobacterales bacterium F-183]
MFGFEVSPWELIVRGTLIYWFLFLLFRFGLRRDAGSVGLADVLLVVIIADASQNGMAGDYKTIPEAMVLVGTIAIWNLLIDWASFHFPWFRRFAQPRPLPLIQGGQLQRANLRRELISTDEIMTKLREEGCTSVKEVKLAFLEPDGHISIIRAEDEKTR